MGASQIDVYSPPLCLERLSAWISSMLPFSRSFTQPKALQNLEGEPYYLLLHDVRI